MVQRSGGIDFGLQIRILFFFEVEEKAVHPSPPPDHPKDVKILTFTSEKQPKTKREVK